MDPRINTHIGRYLIQSVLGTGGMSVVYQAFDEQLKRQVALKLLHHHLLENIEARKRIQREAHAVASLHHKAIVAIYDYSGDSANDLYIVSEFVHGESLAQWLEKHPLMHPECALLVLSPIVAALQHAHSRGIFTAT